MRRTLGQRCGGVSLFALATVLTSTLAACGGLDGAGIPNFDASTLDGSAPDGFVVHHDAEPHHDGEAHHEGGHEDALSHVDSAVDAPAGHDSGNDATSDAHHEAGLDGASDATVDSSQDGARDGSADVGVDAGKDSATPPHDAGVDAPVNPCMDGVQDGNETGIDCGGGTCPACGVGVGCKVNSDCLPGDGCDATTNVCDIGLCTDGIEDGKETGIDCGGGTCPVCTVGKGCKTNADCTPGDGCDVVTKVCDSNECSDGIQDGAETAIDCGGGTCPGCGVGKGCSHDSDCASGAGCDVATKTCDDNSCNDGTKDGNETGIDCGGGTCAPCTVGQGCNTDADCVTGEGCDVTTKLCDGNLCNDGIKDGNETATDCGGGTCPACTVGQGCKVDSDCVTGEGCDVTKKTCDANECNDGILDGAETAIDCGGGTCPGCAVGKACNVDADCASPGGCDVTTKKCDANECHDGLQDGAETDIDCGGGTCPACPLGDKCKVTSDCVTGEGCDVTTHKCDANECNDGVEDGVETGIDCGGGTCPACALGEGCLNSSDCTTDYCFETKCVPVCTNVTFQATGAQQQIAITATGTYTITAYGSQGGASGYNTNGGDGDYVQASFALTAGQTLQIVAGARTASVGSNQGGGGGGGSFVYIGTAATPLPAQPLVVAGGGGGGNGGGGVVASGTGNGGGAGGGTGGGGGGTGWLTTGGSNGGGGGGHWGGGGGNSFAGTNGSAGGFGGGGGADVFNSNGGGGGGGYTGGAGGGGGAATGGTSYVGAAGTSVTETAASHTGAGSVTITGPIATSCTP